MIKDFVKRLIDDSEREVKKLSRIVEDINRLEDQYRQLADEDFPRQTEQFKQRLTEGETLDDILPEAFALVREAARRTLGMRHLTFS